MPSILDFVDVKGRVNYKQLKELSATISIGDFQDLAKYPFLVGKELYDGELFSRPSKLPGTSTMRFHAAEFRKGHTPPSGVEVPGRGYSPMDSEKTAPLSQAPSVGSPQNIEQSGLSQAIFIVRRKPYSQNPENIISVGRAISNDVVVPDYVVSKTHAMITVFKNMFFIADHGSTNGTKVNHMPIAPGSKVQLNFNDTVAFGRIVFVFTNPLNILSALRKEALGL
jgi:hypothetical protein